MCAIVGIPPEILILSDCAVHREMGLSDTLTRIKTLLFIAEEDHYVDVGEAIGIVNETGNGNESGNEIANGKENGKENETENATKREKGIGSENENENVNVKERGNENMDENENESENKNGDRNGDRIGTGIGIGLELQQDLRVLFRRLHLQSLLSRDPPPLHRRHLQHSIQIIQASRPGYHFRAFPLVLAPFINVLLLSLPHHLLSRHQKVIEKEATNGLGQAIRI